MESDDDLAARIRKALGRKKCIEAKKTFGGLCVEVIDPFGNRIRFNEDLKAATTT